MIGELIQKMQELAASDGDNHYEVISLPESEKDNDDIMACYECTYDQAREIEGMLNTNFLLDKGKPVYLICIKRIKSKQA